MANLRTLTGSIRSITGGRVAASVVFGSARVGYIDEKIVFDTTVRISLIGEMGAFSIGLYASAAFDEEVIYFLEVSPGRRIFFKMPDADSDWSGVEIVATPTLSVAPVVISDGPAVVVPSGGSGDNNVQSDWLEDDVEDDAFIRNKPSIPDPQDIPVGQDQLDDEIAARVEGDAALEDRIDAIPDGVSSTDFIDEVLSRQAGDRALGQRIDDIPAGGGGVGDVTQDELDAEAAFRRNADIALGQRIDAIPAGGGGVGDQNVQADWDEEDQLDDSFIRNKPTLPDPQDVPVGQDQLDAEVTARTNEDINLNRRITGLTQQIHHIDVGDLELSGAPIPIQFPSYQPYVVGVAPFDTNPDPNSPSGEYPSDLTDLSFDFFPYLPHVHADWIETNSQDPSYIRNKPDLEYLGPYDNLTNRMRENVDIGQYTLRHGRFWIVHQRAEARLHGPLDDANDGWRAIDGQYRGIASGASRAYDVSDHVRLADGSLHFCFLAGEYTAAEIAASEDWANLTAGDAESISAALTAEIAAREAGDTALGVRIDELPAGRTDADVQALSRQEIESNNANYVDPRLAAEALQRSGADIALGERIDAIPGGGGTAAGAIRFRGSHDPNVDDYIVSDVVTTVLGTDQLSHFWICDDAILGNIMVPSVELAAEVSGWELLTEASHYRGEIASVGSHYYHVGDTAFDAANRHIYICRASGNYTLIAIRTSLSWTNLSDPVAPTARTEVLVPFIPGSDPAKILIQSIGYVTLADGYTEYGTPRYISDSGYSLSVVGARDFSGEPHLVTLLTSGGSPGDSTIVSGDNPTLNGDLYNKLIWEPTQRRLSRVRGHSAVPQAVDWGENALAPGHVFEAGKIYQGVEEHRTDLPHVIPEANVYFLRESNTFTTGTADGHATQYVPPGDLGAFGFKDEASGAVSADGQYAAFADPDTGNDQVFPWQVQSFEARERAEWHLDPYVPQSLLPTPSPDPGPSGGAGAEEIATMFIPAGFFSNGHLYRMSLFTADDLRLTDTWWIEMGAVHGVRSGDGWASPTYTGQLWDSIQGGSLGANDGDTSHTGTGNFHSISFAAVRSDISNTGTASNLFTAVHILRRYRDDDSSEMWIASPGWASLFFSSTIGDRSVRLMRRR